MRFSIITPSFRQLGWLQRCARSIADQTGVEVEHIIQDAGTGPELDAWVRNHTRAQLHVEKDAGMYDAINRGMDRATGDLMAFLNCDEQYLPGTLEAVTAMFAAHPETDLIVGDFLILDPAAKLLSFRRVTPLRRLFLATDHLYAFTCATFFRRKIWDAGIRYQTQFKAVADGRWLFDVLDHGFRPRNLRRFLSIYTDTGVNLGVGTVGQEERKGWFATLPRWQRLLAPVFRRLRQVEKYLAGGYASRPIAYEVYASDDAEARTRFLCEKPSGRYQIGPPASPAGAS